MKKLLAKSSLFYLYPRVASLALQQPRLASLSAKFTSLTFFLIIVTAIFVRFYHLDIKMRFIWDEGRDMMAIHNMVANKNITLFGPFNEIDGQKDFFGVFHYYLMALPLLLANFDPIGPAIFTALLGVGSVILVYFLLKQWTIEKKALLVSFFYAVSPLVIQYVQWPWNPNTVPFFALLYFLCLSSILKKKEKNKQWLWASLAGLLLGILFQLHYFTIPLGMAYLLIFFFEKKKNWRELLFFLLFFILPNLSFLIFDLTHEYFYFNILKESFIGSSSQRYFIFSITSFFIIPVKYVFEVINGLFFGNTFFTIIFEFIFFFQIFKNIFYFKKNREVTLPVLLSFVWLGFLLMISFFLSVFDGYHSSYLWFSIFYFFVEFFGTKVLFLVAYGIVSVLMFRNIDLNRVPEWSENMPLVRELSGIVVNDYQNNFSESDSEKLNVVSFTDTDNRATRYRYFFQKSGLKIDGVDQYPNATVLYIISPHSVKKMKDNPVWEVESFVDEEWSEVGEKNSVFIYRVVK